MMVYELILRGIYFEKDKDKTLRNEEKKCPVLGSKCIFYEEDTLECYSTIERAFSPPFFSVLYHRKL